MSKPTDETLVRYFVVHARVGPAGISGTAENLATGAKTRFQSGNELVALVGGESSATGGRDVAP